MAPPGEGTFPWRKEDHSAPGPGPCLYIIYIIYYIIPGLGEHRKPMRHPRSGRWGILRRLYRQIRDRLSRKSDSPRLTFASGNPAGLEANILYNIRSTHGCKDKWIRTKPLRRGLGGSPRQEQEGSRWQSHRGPNILILFIRTLRPFSEGLPKQDPNPREIRTERTLAESRVVLI